jgi:DNA-binding winged helix-turn-helix (wHTH) protein
VTFGEFRLDTGTRQLFHGTAEVRLTPKAFDLLTMLVENRSRAMSKAELHEHLWPGTFVTEATLASLVAEVRRALGDRAHTPTFIRTVHRFGYAFCGELADAPAPSAPSVSCWLIRAGRETLLGEGENVIGRDPAAAIRLDFPSVSRRHARVLVSPAGATVEDLGSKNGTRVRGVAVHAATPLSDFDELEIGSVRLTVRLLRGGEPTETMAG